MRSRAQHGAHADKASAQHRADRTPQRLGGDEGCHEEPERRAERRCAQPLGPNPPESPGHNAAKQGTNKPAEHSAGEEPDPPGSVPQDGAEDSS